MCADNLELPYYDPFEELIADMEQDAQAEAEQAWKSCCELHISPTRIVEIALEGAKLTSEESSHLQFCDSCQIHYADYSELRGRFIEDAKAPSIQAGAGAASVGYNARNGFHASAGTLGQVAGNSVPPVVANAFLVESPILFPGGEVARVSWQFGRIGSAGKCRSQLVEHAFNVCCDELLAAIRSNFQKSLRNKVIVAFGEAMHECGVELATRILEIAGIAPHVVLAHDYYNPKLVCDPRELHQADVIVLVDVVHSGSLLRRLVALCSQFSPATVSGLALIDQSGARVEQIEFTSIWSVNREVRETIEEFRRIASSSDIERLRVFDPNRSDAMRQYIESSIEIEDTTTALRMEGIDSELQKCIERTGAMKRDFRIGKKRYAFAVNVLDLLRKDVRSRDYVLERSLGVLADCTFHRTCLAYHAGRSRRAGFIAKLLGDITGWPSLAMGAIGNAFALTKQQCQQFASFDNVVIVDAAIRTGETMAAISQAIAKEKIMAEPRVLGFCILNSLTKVELDFLSSELDIELRSAFRLPLAPPSYEIRHWTSQQKTMIGRELIERCKSELIRRVLMDYCAPAIRKVFGNSNQSIDKSALILQKAISHARKTESPADQISFACSSQSPSAIRHLDVDDVINDRTVQSMLNGIMFNSMKPQFKESAAIALAAAGRYDWMNLRWLKVNEPFLSSRGSSWMSVVMIEQLMSKDGRDRDLKTFKDAVIEYREFRIAAMEKRKPIYSQTNLFTDLSGGDSFAEVEDVVSDRLDTFIEAAQA